jgi:dCMP deaminase
MEGNFQEVHPVEAADGRPAWDEYFTLTPCGAALVRDRRILSTGYNGAPSGLRHCLSIGCLREQMKVPSGERHELCRGLHAEQNAIIQAALHGVSVKGSILYCTNHPCIICAKMIINAGIARIVIRGDYHDDLAAEMLAEAGIEVIRQ